MACSVYEAVIYTAHASDQELPNVLCKVTDGALTVKATGGRVVLYHTSLGILRPLFFRFQVTVATSADAEWLPKLVARYMLRKWLGHAHFIADATAALHGTHTNFSPPSTYANHIYWRVVAATASFQEFWLQAQHDTGHAHTVASLQRLAHQLASRGASQARPLTVPLLHLLLWVAVAMSSGRVLFNTRMGVEQQHVQGLQALYSPAHPDALCPVQPCSLTRPVPSTALLTHTPCALYSPAHTHALCPVQPCSLTRPVPSTALLRHTPCALYSPAHSHALCPVPLARPVV